MAPLVVPVVAELGLELAPVILYGGYKVAEFAHKGGFKILKGIIDNRPSKKKSKVKK